MILAGFLVYPLVYGIVLSLHDTQGFDLTSFVGLDHYARAILGDAVFHRSLLNTVLFTGVAVVLQTGLGLFLAVLVADAKRGQDVLPVRVLRARSSSPRWRSAWSGSSCTRRSSGSRRRWGRRSGSTR